MRRHLAWGLACLALCIGAASAPARAEVTHYPSTFADARTADFDLVGTIRVQLDVTPGAFLSGGQSWAAKYSYNVEFDAASNVEAVVTSVEPSGCGQPYSLASTGAWKTSTYQDFSSRLLFWEVDDPANGLPGGGAATFTGYTDAKPAAGRITVRGFVKLNGDWQAWVAELFGVTMGCDLFDPPAQPSMTLAISSNKNPIGLGETLTTTIVVDNTGATDLQNVVVTQDVVPNTTYVPNSTILNGATVADVNGDTALTDGLTVNIPAGGTATIACSMTVDRGARGTTLNCVAHAAVDGFLTLSASAQVAVTDSVESALAALADLIQAAKDAGAFRGHLVRNPFNPGTATNPNFIFKIFDAGQPKFVRLLAAINKALAAGNRTCAIAFLDRIAADATNAPGRNPANPAVSGPFLLLFNDDAASQAFGPKIAAAAKAVKTLILAGGPATGSTSDCAEKFVAPPQ